MSFQNITSAADISGTLANDVAPSWKLFSRSVCCRYLSRGNRHQSTSGFRVTSFLLDKEKQVFVTSVKYVGPCKRSKVDAKPQERSNLCWAVSSLWCGLVVAKRNTAGSAGRKERTMINAPQWDHRHHRSGSNVNTRPELPGPDDPTVALQENYVIIHLFPISCSVYEHLDGPHRCC